ncbi:hypothetical protein Trydic_g8312 [Trypoxylus dichotomus]
MQMRVHSVIFVLHCGFILCYGDNYYNSYNWKFHFPEGSSMGLFFSFAMPLDIPNKNVFLSYYFEAVYGLPGNLTEETYPPLVARDGSTTYLTKNVNDEYRSLKTINRKLVYNIFEEKLTTHGYPGHLCLLRAICETALMPIRESNGVLGDIFHVIFTPSSSRNEELDDDYKKAEGNGKTKRNCEMYYESCNTSFIDLISWFEHAFDK